MHKSNCFFKGMTLISFISVTYIVNAQVGIGLTNPSSQLTVNEDATFNESGGNHDFRVEGDTQTNLFFVDASTDRIGVNTNTPGFQFEVTNNGNIGATSLARSSNNGTNGVAFTGYNLNASNAYNGIEGVTNGSYSGVFGLYLNTSGFGNGVFGITNSSDALGVYGSIPITGTWLGFGGYFEGGLGYVNGLYNISDARTKTNISKIENTLDKLINISGYTYSYDLNQFNPNRTNNNRMYYGFLAQNVKKYFPHAVAEKKVRISNDSTTLNTKNSNSVSKIIDVVDYTALTPILVEALKEQQLLIKQQKEEIEAMKKRIEKLEKLLNP